MPGEELARLTGRELRRYDTAADRRRIDAGRTAPADARSADPCAAPTAASVDGQPLTPTAAASRTTCWVAPSTLVDASELTSGSFWPGTVGTQDPEQFTPACASSTNGSGGSGHERLQPGELAIGTGEANLVSAEVDSHCSLLDRNDPAEPVMVVRHAIVNSELFDHGLGRRLEGTVRKVPPLCDRLVAHRLQYAPARRRLRTRLRVGQTAQAIGKAPARRDRHATAAVTRRKARHTQRERVPSDRAPEGSRRPSATSELQCLDAN